MLKVSTILFNCNLRHGAASFPPLWNSFLVRFLTLCLSLSIGLTVQGKLSLVTLRHKRVALMTQYDESDCGVTRWPTRPNLENRFEDLGEGPGRFSSAPK